MSGLSFADLRALAPELALVLAAASVLLADLAHRGNAPRRSGWIAFTGAALAGACSLANAGGAPGARIALVECDGLAALFQATLIGGALVVLAAQLLDPGARGISARRAFLLLAGTAGGCRMVATDHGLAMLLGAAILSLATSGLAAEDGARGPEVASKHFVASAFALAVSLFGASLLFGLGGSLDLVQLGKGGAAGLFALASDPFPAALALALFCAAFAQLAAVAPLHAASVDALDGSSAPTAVWLAVVARTAGVGALLRTVATLFVRDGAPDAAASFAPRAGLVLAVLAAATMLLGALCALRQAGLRRTLAWSSVGQTGAVLLAVACASETGCAAASIGAVAFALTNAGMWLAAGRMERRAGSDRIEDLRGSLKSEPVAAACLLFSFAAAAGLPATLGGYAKFRLCLEAWSSGLGGGWALLVLLHTLLSLACLVRVSTVPGTLLRFRNAARATEPASAGASDADSRGARASLALVAALALTALALGLWPRPLERWAQTALDFLRE